MGRDARSLTAGGLLAGTLFFLAPAGVIAGAVALRTARVVESYASVVDRVLVHGAHARAASDSEGVELELLLAVAAAESSGRPAVRSSAGAVGLMQLLPGTAAEMAAALGEPKPDLTDPADSFRLGARYLRRQLDRFEGTAAPRELALAAYNAGPETVRAWLEDGGPESPEDAPDWIRWDETRAYVRRVLDYEARFRAELSPAGAR